MVPPARRSPPAVPPRKGERTRRAILRAAAEQLAIQTPGAVTMDDIAYAAKVSTGTIYNYFTNKEALLAAWVTDALAELEQRYDAVEAHASPIVRVYGYGEQYVQFSIDRPVQARFILLRALQSPPASEHAAMNAAIAQSIDQAMSRVHRELERAVELDEIPSVPIPQTASLLWALWTGLAMLALRDDEQALSPDAADRMLAMAQQLLGRAHAHLRERPIYDAFAAGRTP